MPTFPAPRFRSHPHPRQPRPARPQRAGAAKSDLRPLERDAQLSAGARRRPQGSPARRTRFHSESRTRTGQRGGCARHGGGGSDRGRVEEKIGAEEWVNEAGSKKMKGGELIPIPVFLTPQSTSPCPFKSLPPSPSDLDARLAKSTRAKHSVSLCGSLSDRLLSPPPCHSTSRFIEKHLVMSIQGTFPSLPTQVPTQRANKTQLWTEFISYVEKRIGLLGV